MKNRYTLLLMAMILAGVGKIEAQDSSRIFLTTGTGIIKSPGALHHVFHPSLAFNSGIELTNKHNYFIQASFDFNTLKYNQLITDESSPFLFQNTSSSLIMLAVSAGKNFHFSHNKWFSSVYTGGGYLNIGEPRLQHLHDNIIYQEVSRKPGVFAKAGLRIGYRTKIKFLQTIYFDGAWWESALKVQGAYLKGASLFLGLRMAI